MVLSTYLAYSLKLAVSMETAFPRDFRAWEEAHISSSAISSSKPLMGSSSFFTGVTLLLPISASPAEQKHRSTGWASRQRISGGMGARTEWGSCFHKRQRWEPVWKPLCPTHHPFPSFCVTSFWSRFQKWKKFYMNSTQLKARCAPQERAHQCMDLLWQIRKSWVTCSSQMTVFFSKSSLLLWFINTPQVKWRVWADGSLSLFHHEFLHQRDGPSWEWRRAAQTEGALSEPRSPSSLQGISSAQLHHLPGTSRAEQRSRAEQIGQKNQTCKSFNINWGLRLWNLGQGRRCSYRVEQWRNEPKL